MDSLPTEVLVHIFSYLKPCDRLETSLVCKRWLQVNNCLDLLKDIHLTIYEPCFLPDQLSRNFSSFKFRRIVIDCNFVALLKLLGRQLYYLSLGDCDFSRELDDFDGKVDYLNNLKILEITQTSAFYLFSSLPLLVELYLYTEFSISDQTLLRFKYMMPKLRVFFLSCDICFDKRAYKRFYPNEINVETNPSPMVLSFPAVEFYIRERSRTLQVLGFDHTSISAAALSAISNIENLQLQKISLRDCKECGKGLEDLFRNQTQLKEVNLNGVREILSDAVKAMCLLPNLRKVKVSESQYITRFSAERIFQLSKLEEIDFSKCKDITVNGFDLATSQLKAFKLKVINLSSCNIGSKAISKLINSCRYLTFLDLSDCEVSDQNVNEMSRMLALLTYLKLSRCRGITDLALTGYSNCDMKEEQEKNMSLPEDSNPKMNVKKNENWSLSNIKGLKKLYLNDCHQITSVGIVEGLKLQELDTLDIRGCSISANVVCNLRTQNPNLDIIFDTESGPEWLIL